MKAWIEIYPSADEALHLTTERKGKPTVYNAWRSCEERKSEKTRNKYQWREKEKESGSMVNKRSWAWNRVVRIVRILWTRSGRRGVGVNVGVGRWRALILNSGWWWGRRRRRCHRHYRGTWILASSTACAYNWWRRRRGRVDNLPIVHACMIRQQRKHQHE